jgi:plastocyanin
VKSGLETLTFAVPSEPVVIDQQRCRYLPRVVGVRVGQPLQIHNGDPLLHNVRSDGEINQPFNQGQPVQGMTFSYTFTTREVMVPVKCDVHAWMRAYVGAMEHPYFAVTGAGGTFALPNLPAGTYTIAAWHERLGTREQQVTVAAGESKDVEFTFAR